MFLVVILTCTLGYFIYDWNRTKRRIYDLMTIGIGKSRVHDRHISNNFTKFYINTEHGELFLPSMKVHSSDIEIYLFNALDMEINEDNEMIDEEDYFETYNETKKERLFRHENNFIINIRRPSDLNNKDKIIGVVIDYTQLYYMFFSVKDNNLIDYEEYIKLYKEKLSNMTYDLDIPDDESVTSDDLMRENSPSTNFIKKLI